MQATNSPKIIDQNNLDECSPEILLSMLGDAFGITVEKLILGARIVARLDAFGIAIPRERFNRGYINYLRLISQRSITAEHATQFFTRPDLVRLLSKLPSPLQFQVIEKGVAVVYLDEDKRERDRIAPIATLSRDELRRAFDGDRLRTRAEQLAVLLREPNTKPSGLPGIKMDRRRRGIIVEHAGAFIGAGDLIRIAAELSAA